MISNLDTEINPSFIFEITPSCNFECIYCYNSIRDNSENPKKQLNLKLIQKLFDKISSKTNIDSITIAGGEPLLHKDLFNVIKYFRKKGIKTGITTNGSLLSEEPARLRISSKAAGRLNWWIRQPVTVPMPELPFRPRTI